MIEHSSPSPSRCGRYAAITLVITLLAVSACAASWQQVESPEEGGGYSPPGATMDTGPTGYLFTKVDTRFMQHMMLHHAQALVMSELARERTEREEIRLMATRIERSQEAEIESMRQWLEERGQAAPDPTEIAHSRPAARECDERRGHHDHPEPSPESKIEAQHDLPGMLTGEQLQRLAAASGREFDKLFLQMMIYHHEGALDMVAELFATPRAAQDPKVFEFASHVNSDQRAEIRRMLDLLNTLEAQR